MRSKAETLRLVVSIALKPLEGADFRPVAPGQRREADPLWQVGHAAFDACRGLVSPFRDSEIEARFGDRFHGEHSVEPWNADRPEPPAVFAWWDAILTAAEHTLNARSGEDALPAPIAFTAYTVHTVGEAYDYVVYHTSFHAGLAQAAFYRRGA